MSTAKKTGSLVAGFARQWEEFLHASKDLLQMGRGYIGRGLRAMNIPVDPPIPTNRNAGVRNRLGSRRPRVPMVAITGSPRSANAQLRGAQSEQGHDCRCLRPPTARPCEPGRLEVDGLG